MGILFFQCRRSGHVAVAYPVREAVRRKREFKRGSTCKGSLSENFVRSQEVDRRSESMIVEVNLSKETIFTLA